MRNKSKNSLYRTWCNIKSRCNNPNIPSYKNYGERGIKVCERWINSFEAFLEDMKIRPPNMTIERIDTNGDYSPENCKWATKQAQARNTRWKRELIIDGITYHVQELSEKYGIDPKTIWWRMSQGWPLEKVFSKENHWNNEESQKKAAAAHAAMKKAQTHCKRGHEFTEENTYKHDGRRICRQCRKAIDRYLYNDKKGVIEDYL